MLDLAGKLQRLEDKAAVGQTKSGAHMSRDSGSVMLAAISGFPTIVLQTTQIIGAHLCYRLNMLEMH
jgi:hypothetical protein